MEKRAGTMRAERQPPRGGLKGILRGGTFGRVQVLISEGQPTVEHCGLSYRVTHQKDKLGRVICVWSGV